MKKIKKDISVFLPNPDQSTLDINTRTFSSGEVMASLAFLEESLRLKSGDSLLEYPCGDGRRSFELARRGIRVTGVTARVSQRTRLEVAAKKEEIPVRFLSAVDSALDLAVDSFDAAICDLGLSSEQNPLNARGAVKGRDLNKVARALDCLREGGLLFLTAFHQEWVDRHLYAEDWSEPPERVELNHRSFQVFRRREAFYSTASSSTTAFERRDLGNGGYLFEDLLRLVSRLGGRVVRSSNDFTGEKSEWPSALIFVVAEKISAVALGRGV